jgi:hypothetical protein
MGMKAFIAASIAFATFASVAACGGEKATEPPPATGVTAAQPKDGPGRLLTESECQSLGHWMADACQSRPNERSARVDGWCSDVLRGVETGAWTTRDCAKHITYIDSTCFRSSTNVHDLMECDQAVSRP